MKNPAQTATEIMRRHRNNEDMLHSSITNEIACATLDAREDMDPLMREAWELTNGERANTYGRAEEVFEAYGHIFTGILKHKLRDGQVITASDVTLLMTGLKIGREAGGEGQKDNVIDAHGYLSLHARIKQWVISRRDRHAA